MAGASTGNPYLAGAQAAGSLISAYGSIMASRAQAKGLNQQASLLGLSAQEIRDRARQNVERKYRQAEIEKSLRSTDVTLRGGSPTTATDFDSNLVAFQQAREEATDMLREADWEAKKMEFEANQARATAKTTKKVGILQGLGSILGGSVDSYKAYNNY